MEKYLNGAEPQIGISPGSDCSLLELSEFLMNNASDELRTFASQTFSHAKHKNVTTMIQTEFHGLLSPTRIKAIVSMLDRRYATLQTLWKLP